MLVLAKVATLIDGHRTVLDIVHELREYAQSQDVFHVLFILSDWDLIVSDDFNPQTVVCWQRPEAAKRLRSLFESSDPSLDPWYRSIPMMIFRYSVTRPFPTDRSMNPEKKKKGWAVRRCIPPDRGSPGKKEFWPPWVNWRRRWASPEPME